MKLLNVKFDENKQYDIIIGENMLLLTGEICKKIFNSAKKAAIICDDVVSRLYSKLVYDIISDYDFECYVIEFKSGEASKSHDSLVMIYDTLTRFKFSRTDFIVALGGGVTGDLAGFTAATYLRGVGYIQVPTTLLAMVDSSVGGKTAVNLKGGKNLVGAFYQPRLVLCDSVLLNSLPGRAFNDGMAEVIKHAFIKDKGLYDIICDQKNIKNNIKEVIYKNCAIKAAIVEGDEYDTSSRMLLNFGHTIAHAVESFYNYEKYTHGEAVAIGMSCISIIGEKLEITQKSCSRALIALLKKYDLPYKIDKKIVMEICDIIKNDKKNFGGQLNIVLLKDIARPLIYKIEMDRFLALVKKHL